MSVGANVEVNVEPNLGFPDKVSFKWRCRGQSSVNPTEGCSQELSRIRKSIIREELRQERAGPKIEQKLKLKRLEPDLAAPSKSCKGLWSFS